MRQKSTENHDGVLCHYCMMVGALAYPEDLSHTPDSSSPDQLPERLGSHLILEEIGRGGMGVVFRAKEEKLNREVALKVVLDGRLAGQESVSRFLREAHSAARLDHPAITPVYEIGEDKGFIYYSSRLMQGGSLAELIEKPDYNDHDVEQTQKDHLQMIFHLAQGLHHGHQHGIIHRDIKPGNILLDEYQQAYITDFGLAKQLDPTESQLTLTGLTAGSPNYMAPEQLEGSHITQSVDIYALGAVLYELLCGKPPFQGNSLASIYRDIHTRDASFPVSSRHIHRSLQAICLKCLSKKPEQRYPSAASLAEDIQRYLQGLPVNARRISNVERLILWTQRKPVIATLSITLTLALFCSCFLLIKNAHLDAQNHRIEHTARIKAQEQEQKSRHKLAWEIMTKANELCRQQGPSQHAKLFLKAAELSHDDEALRHEALKIFASWADSFAHIYTHSKDGPTEVVYTTDGSIATYGPNAVCQIITPNKEPLNIHHDNRVSCADFSPNGKIIATYAEPDVYLHDTHTGKLIHRFKKKSSIILQSNPIEAGASCSFSPNGKLLTIAYPSEPAVVYDVTSRKLVHHLPAPECDHLLGSSLKITYSPNNQYLVIVYQGGCRVTQLESGHSYFISAGKSMADATVSTNNQWLAIADTDFSAKVFELSTGKLISKAKHLYKLTSLAFSPNNKQLVTASRDRSSLLFDIDPSGMLTQQRMYRHPAAVIDVLWHPTGNSITTLCDDGHIRVFSPHSKHALQKIPVQTARPHKVHLVQSIDQKTSSFFLIEGAQGKIARHPFPIPSEHVARLGMQAHHLRVLPSKSGFATASNHPKQHITLKTWTLEGKPLGPRLDPHSSGVIKSTLSLSHDGKWATSCTTPARIRTWNTITNQLVFDQHVSDEICRNTATGQSLVASIDRTCTLRLHDIHSGQLHSQYRLPTSSTCMVFSPDESLLAVATSERIMCFAIHPKGIHLLHQKARHKNQVLALTFSPDGKTLASGGMDHEARLWDAYSGNPKSPRMKHPDYVWALAFNHDGTLLATAGQYSVIHFWHTYSGLQCGAPVPQSSWINALAFHQLEDTKEVLFAAGSDFILRKIPLPKRNLQSIEIWNQWLLEKTSDPSLSLSKNFPHSTSEQ